MRKHKRFNTLPSQQQGIRSTSSTSSHDQRPAGLQLFCKRSINFYKKTSNITLPIPIESQEQPSLSHKLSQAKHFPERLIPPRNNLRCLNDFLKQQALFIRSKQRIISNLSSKQISNSPLELIKEKIINMIKMQTTQSELLLKQNSLESFNNVRFKTFELDCQPAEEKQLKDKQSKCKLPLTAPKRLQQTKPRPERLVSLTPILRSPPVPKAGSNSKLKKTLKMETSSIRNSVLSKNNHSSQTNQQSKQSCCKINITFDEKIQ